jgi:membrane-associated protease RseP (regulator of RpoE activity)
MSQNPANSSDFTADPNTTICANCRTPMPFGLRFCRNCGYRLGEGVAEYTDTVRFADSPQGAYMPGPGQAQPLTTTYGLSNSMTPVKKRKRMSGMTWMFIGLLVFCVAAAAFTAIISPRRNPGFPTVVRLAPRSYVGVNAFETTDGGVTFQNVEPPGSPADKAGLVGGDVITTFDGHKVTEDDEISDLLRETPIGKTVEVVYIRDGETKTTQLTTVNKEEFERLARAFANRPEGRGRFGYESDEAERVPIEGTKIFGVRLDSVESSRPADLAGIKVGDVIIEFDGTPIRTPDELASRVRRAIPYSTVKVVLMRGVEKLEIPVKMGKQ